MKLNETQRLEGYKYALYQIQNLHDTISGVCELLEKHAVDLNDYVRWTDWHYKEIDINYPEFFISKPENADKLTIWWNFDSEGTASRIAALKAAIALIESQSTPGTTQQA